MHDERRRVGHPGEGGCGGRGAPGVVEGARHHEAETVGVGRFGRPWPARRRSTRGARARLERGGRLLHQLRDGLGVAAVRLGEPGLDRAERPGAARLDRAGAHRRQVRLVGGDARAGSAPTTRRRSRRAPSGARSRRGARRSAAPRRRARGAPARRRRLRTPARRARARPARRRRARSRTRRRSATPSSPAIRQSSIVVPSGVTSCATRCTRPSRFDIVPVFSPHTRRGQEHLGALRRRRATNVPTAITERTRASAASTSARSGTSASRSAPSTTSVSIGAVGGGARGCRACRGRRRPGPSPTRR